MLRLFLLLLVLVACTPSPRKAVMPNPSPVSGNIVQSASDAGSSELRSAKPDPQAMQGPFPEPVSGNGIPAPAITTESSAAVLGRRTVSTTFVRVGPEGHLTVELHDGRVLVLRDVTMGPNTYCGVQVSGARYCGDYADVAAARSGGAPTPDLSDPASGSRAKPTS